MKKKQLALLLILLCGISLYAQNIFDYEKEIQHQENYLFKEINFKVLAKKDTIQLSGTLISPKGDFDKLIVIVPGSGADTRNSHYLLTEKLLQDNIAVYRYDERGIGKSQGKFNTANNTITTMSEELASCIATLRKANPGKKLGLLGHSQGGMVTIQAYAKGAPVDFLIQWATPVQKHGAFIKYQVVSGQNSFKDLIQTDDTIKKLAIMTALHKVVEENLDIDDWSLTKKLDKASKKIGYTKAYYTRFPYLTLASEKDIVRKNFEPVYKGITIPVLYIIGTKDTFVDPMAETQVIQGFENKNITTIKMEGLTHYLTREKLTLSNLYQIDADAVSVILEWLNKLK